MTYTGTPGAFDYRSQAQIDLENVTAAIRSIISDDSYESLVLYQTDYNMTTGSKSLTGGNYNFEVRNVHTYLADGYLVHNGGGGKGGK